MKGTEMDYIKAKIYELLIRFRRKIVSFEYFVEINFITQTVKPNTKSYVIVNYEMPAFLGSNENNITRFKIYENIKEAYQYFK